MCVGASLPCNSLPGDRVLGSSLFFGSLRQHTLSLEQLPQPHGGLKLGEGHSLDMQRCRRGGWEGHGREEESELGAEVYLSSGLGMLTQEECLEVKASLVYTVSSRPAWMII